MPQLHTIVGMHVCQCEHAIGWRWWAEKEENVHHIFRKCVTKTSRVSFSSIQYHSHLLFFFFFFILSYLLDNTLGQMRTHTSTDHMNTNALNQTSVPFAQLTFCVTRVTVASIHLYTKHALWSFVPFGNGTNYLIRATYVCLHVNSSIHMYFWLLSFFCYKHNTWRSSSFFVSSSCCCLLAFCHRQLPHRPN